MSRLALSLNDRTELHDRLNQVGRVLKLQAVVTWSLRMLVVGLLADCLWLAGARFLPYPARPATLLVVPAVAAILGALAAGLWRTPAVQIARRADRELRLKERLITALELQRTRMGGPLVGLQLRDAVDQLRRVEALEAFPVRLPGRELNLLLALGLVAVALLLAPNPMEQVVRQREQVAVTVRQEAERINKLADELSEMEDPEDFVDIQDVLRSASSTLRERQLGPDEANAALQRLEQQLLAQQDPSTGDLDDTLNSLAGSLASEPTTRDLGTSLARGDIRQAAREMRRLGDEAESMSPQDRSKLARALRQAGNRSSRANQELSQALLSGSDALENGQSGEAQEALGNAADQLDASSSRLRAASQRERALAQLQQSRSSINRSQQAAQSRAGTGQRGQGQQGAGAGAEGMDDFGSASDSGEGDPGSGDRPGGSSAGVGQGSHDEMIYDPMMTVGRPDFVPPPGGFDPNDAFENPDLNSPYGSEAQVPYRQAYAQYQERATQTLQNSYIPAGLKDIVKDYFSSLAPSNNK
jgi:hypothetical protein